MERPGFTPASDRVERRFRPNSPNVLWVADITYLRTGEGWLYLAAVQDAYSRQVVGWPMATNIRATLVVDKLARLSVGLFETGAGRRPRRRRRCRPAGARQPRDRRSRPSWSPSARTSSWPTSTDPKPGSVWVRTSLSRALTAEWGSRASLAARPLPAGGSSGRSGCARACCEPETRPRSRSRSPTAAAAAALRNRDAMRRRVVPHR
jgi:hypothetical protein